MLKAHTELSKLLLIPEGPGSPREIGVRVNGEQWGFVFFFFQAFLILGFPGTGNKR